MSKPEKRHADSDEQEESDERKQQDNWFRNPR
jgi:hypothetical protein